MFKGFPYAFAKNRILIQLADEGVISKEKAKLMQEIAGNAANKTYGVALLKTGTAKCKYTGSCSGVRQIGILLWKKSKKRFI